MAYEVERDWITEAGLRAVAILIPDMHRCGYVEVPDGHPLHGVDYSEETDALSDVPLEELEIGKRGPLTVITAGVRASDGRIRRSPDIAFDVHGGLTFSGSGEKGYPANEKGTGWWFGFDCGHHGDGSLSPRMTSFYQGPVRTEEYVVSECERLAEQIAATFPDHVPLSGPTP